MINNIPSREVIEELKAKFPPRTVVILDHMQDEQAPEIGTAGEVIQVDDIGTVHISWLSGGSLGAAYGEDEIHKATPHETALYRIAKEAKRQKQYPDKPCFCPRCGEEMDGVRRHALSRRADIIICDECGVKESIEDAVAAGVMKGEKALPIEEWAIAKGAYHIYAEEDENGWKVTVPELGAVSHCVKPEDIVPTGEKLRATGPVIYEIYQLKQTEANHGIAFMPLGYLKEKGIRVERERYELVYKGTVDDSTDLLDRSDLLDRIYLKFNTDQPADFKGHSLSVSDVVVIRRSGSATAGKRTAYYVDKMGFSTVPEFIKERIK